jgi:tetratricopeptide (TPR) repeat protein/transcriptional regulator with XRE-family HTH domain
MFDGVVRTLRQRRGLTQEELASKAGIGVRTVRYIESGRIDRPRPSTVRALADAFALEGPDRERFQESALPAPADPLRAAPPEQADSRPTPAQLPPDSAGFTGRTAAMAELDAVVHNSEREPTAAVVPVIVGTAGVGKTTLAIHWAHLNAHRFPDGQLYVNLRGYDHDGVAVKPGDALRGLLDALGVAPQRIPAELDAQAALYRSLLAGRRMLIVLDNARDTAQVRPLLPGTPTCQVLITSRNQLTSLVATDGAYPIVVDLMSTEEAEEMLGRRLGPDRIAGEPATVAEIVTRCARLPLALALVAARAATRPRLPLSALADELRDAQQYWYALTGDDPTTDVRTVFSWSYRALSPAGARLFRLLGLHPGPDISAAAVASLAGERDGVASLVTELIQASLLVEHTTGRYAFHDLLRAYATDLARTDLSEEDSCAATRRMLDHYVHSAYAANRQLDPSRQPITLEPPHDGVTPEEPADHEQALDWFLAEHAVLLAAADRACAAGLPELTWQLSWALRTFVQRSGRWHDWATVAEAAVAAATRLEDPVLRARAHRALSYPYARLGRFDDAHAQLRQSLDFYRRAGDRAGQAENHFAFSLLWEQQGNYLQALHHAEQAHEFYESVGQERGCATALNSIGWFHALLGDYQSAVRYCEQSLALQQKIDDRVAQGNTWDSLGYAHHHLGHYTEAVSCYETAIEMFRELGENFEEATTLTNLGDVHHEIGDAATAQEAWRQALSILERLNHAAAEGVRERLTGLP